MSLACRPASRLAATSQPANPATHPAPRTIKTVDMSLTIYDAKRPQSITIDQAARLFGNPDHSLPDQWTTIVVPVDENAPDALRYQPLPSGGLPPKDGDREIWSVTQFDPDHAIVMILKPDGNYLWHHRYRCLATFLVPRAPQTDQLLGVDQLQRTHGAVFKGVQQGDSEEHVRRQLGEPASLRHTQAIGLFDWNYPSHGIIVQFQYSRVYLIRPLKKDEPLPE